MLSLSIPLLLLDRIPNNSLGHFGIRGGEVFFFVDTSYFVAAVFDELMQALNGGALLVIGSEVKNLSDDAVLPRLNFDLNVGDFLGQGGGVFRNG